MTTSTPFEPIITATWDWILERLDEERVQKLTGGLEPTHEALAIAYPVALEIQEGKPVHWNQWSSIAARSINARALVQKALGDALGDEIKKDVIPLSIAEAAYDLEDESQKPRNPGRSPLDD